MASGQKLDAPRRAGKCACAVAFVTLIFLPPQLRCEKAPPLEVGGGRYNFGTGTLRFGTTGRSSKSVRLWTI